MSRMRISGPFAAAQEMWRDLLTRREDPLKCAFEVRDEKGNELFTLPFSEVLAACGNDTDTAFPAKVNEVSRALETNVRVRQAARATCDAAVKARASLQETIELLRQVHQAAGGDAAILPARLREGGRD